MKWFAFWQLRIVLHIQFKSEMRNVLRILYSTSENKKANVHPRHIFIWNHFDVADGISIAVHCCPPELSRPLSFCRSLRATWMLTPWCTTSSNTLWKPASFALCPCSGTQVGRLAWGSRSMDAPTVSTPHSNDTALCVCGTKCRMSAYPVESDADLISKF